MVKFPLSDKKDGHFREFSDLRALEVSVGNKVVAKALARMSGWCWVENSLVGLRGYGVYLDSESIEADFKVSSPAAKPRLKDIKLTELAVKGIREHVYSCHGTKQQRERLVQKHCRFTRQRELEDKIEYWQIECRRRKERLALRSVALKQFRKDGILLVDVGAGTTRMVEVQREPFGSIH